MEAPLWDILKTQGRSIAWLARQTGYSANYLYLIKMGTRPPSPEFMRRVSAVLQLPERALFLPENLTEVSETHTEGRSHASAA